MQECLDIGERTRAGEASVLIPESSHTERFQQASSFAQAAVALTPGLSGTLAGNWTDYIFRQVLAGRIDRIDWLALQRLDAPPEAGRPSERAALA